MRVVHVWVCADDSAHGRRCACGAPKTGRGLAARRRGRGKLRPNARHARVGARGRQRAWAVLCLRRAPKTGRGLAARRRGRGKLRPNARHARVGARGTTARMGGAMPAACAKDGARVGCKVACAVNCVQTRVMHGDAQDSAHGRRCAGGARPGFARRGMTGITRLCPLVAGSRAPVRHGKGVPMATALCHKKARGCA